MLTEELQHVEAFAAEILRRYFCESDIEFLISTFAPDIIWIGGGDKMIAEGAEEVAACFRAGKKDAIVCSLYDERYSTRKLGEGCYVCQTDCWLLSGEEAELYFHVHQRCTFVFRRAGDKLEAVHIHNSLPTASVRDDEFFPVQASKKAYQQLQAVLAQRESQIELMLAQLPGGLMTNRLDDDMTILWIHESLCHFLGFETPEEFCEDTGCLYQSLMEPDDYRQMCKDIHESLENGDTYYTEYRIRKRDGSSSWVADFGRRLPGEPDSKGLINCFVYDISDRKAKECEIERINQEARQQAKFLSQLYQTVPCGILQFSTDSSHEIIFLNPMVWQFYGFESEKDYRKKIHDPFSLVMDQDRDGLLDQADALVLDGPPCAYTRKALGVDGKELWLAVAMSRLINANGQEVFQAVFSDVTGIKVLQKVQEEARLIENKSLRAAICTIYPKILTVNLTSNTYDCFIEEQQSYLMGDRRGKYDQIVEMAAARIYPSYKSDFLKLFSREQVLEQFSQEKWEIQMEFQMHVTGEGYHWVSIQLIYVDNPVGNDVIAIMLVKSLDSLRAEKAKQEQLLRDALMASKAASSAKSDFLSRMSHDIRTPMNAIIGMSTIGQMKIDDPIRVQDCFRKIDASSRYLLSLINDILDMSKIETGKMELNVSQFELLELIEDINSIIYQQALGKRIFYEIHHKEPLERYYRGDVLRLKQILMNLLSNALKFTPAGGSVTIEIQETRRTNGFAYLQFQVIDTGIGMSKEFLKKIFNPFEQENNEAARNYVGSGLGLAIVHNLVRLMSGVISVESEKDKGTMFTVSLPLELTHDDYDRECERKARELMQGIEVLVVDDDSLVGEQTAAILQDIGALTVWTDSGRKAVELVKERLQEGRVFDIAMVDWRMSGMDGVETVREIRKLVGQDTMIIIISAYDWSMIENEARLAGASSFISKPLFKATILDTFQNLGVERRRSISKIQETCSLSFKILLVEDNELNLEIARMLLELQGFQVEEAENGRAAVDKYMGAQDGTYLAVLMDIRMPVMNGLDAAKAIRKSGKPDAEQIPIFAMSANAFEEDKALAYKVGMNGYFVKPLDIDALTAKLKEIKGGGI